MNEFNRPARGLTPVCALVATALLLPVVALAQSATPGSPAATSGAATAQPPSSTSQPAAGAAAAASPSARRSAQGPTERVEERIKELHAELGITSAQEGPWNTFVQVMRDNASRMEQRLQQRESGFQEMNAEQNLDSYAAIAEQHAEDMQHLAAAFKPLYTSFSDAQKRTADEVFRYRPAAHRTHTASRH